MVIFSGWWEYEQIFAMGGSLLKFSKFSTMNTFFKAETYKQAIENFRELS